MRDMCMEIGAMGPMAAFAVGVTPLLPDLLKERCFSHGSYLLVPVLGYGSMGYGCVCDFHP